MENNKLESKREYIIILGIVVILIFSLLGYSLPYLLNDYNFSIGFDSGINLYKTITGEKNFWDDPLFYTFFSELNNILGINELDNYIALPIFLILPLFLGTYLISFRLLKNRSYALLSVFIVGTSTIFIKGFYESYYKQIFASLVSIFLLYLLSKYKEKKITYILSPLLFSVVFLSHKAIALMTLFFVLAILFIKRKNFKEYIFNLIYFFLFSFVITSPYILKLIPKYLTTLYESFILTLKGVSTITSVPREVVGRSLISDTGNINPFLDLIIYSPFFYLMGLMGALLIKKTNIKRNFGLIFTILLLTIWALLKANFANRFIWNLSIFLLILIPLTIKKINTSRFIKVLIISMIILVLSINYVDYTLTRKPYIIDNIEGINFIEDNINKEGSLIIAPDYIQTSLAQKGYLVSQYYPPLNINLSTGKEIDKLGMVQSDDFLVSGHSNISLLYDYNLTSYEIYVIFGEWDTTIILPRTSLNSKIILADWDNSIYFEKIYEGKSEILRVYHLKEEYKNEN